MIVYYENMNGEKLNLLKAPFRTTKTDWFDADWSESSDGYEKTVTIDVFGKREEFQANMEHLYRIIAVDAENDTYGKLYVNGAYLRCKVLKSAKEGWKGYVYSEVEITFQTPELVWVVEATRQFFHNWKKRQHPESTFSMTIRLILPEKKEESQHGMLITSFQASTG